MDYTIGENRLNKFIWDYLDKNYYPDYMWGDDDDKDFYKREVDKFGFITFPVNDGIAYEYFNDEEFYPEVKVLKVYAEIEDNLDRFFGNFWVPVFVKWFEHNTGLEVETLKGRTGTLYDKRNKSN